MMPSDELQALLALTCTPHLGVINGRRLLEAMGSAKAVYEHRTELPDLIPGARPVLVQALDCPAALKRAEVEIEWIQKHRVRCLAITDEDYPARLRECEDAPLALFYCGNTNLNAKHVVSMVGTRRCSEYGRDLCASFVRDLAKLCPDVLVISGLALGIDVASQRAALTNGLPTVGVLAHGLDRIYPSVHRSIAHEMVQQGGLLTEYMSFTEPERQNFLRRNRIIAGISEHTIVVESAIRGGSLSTARLAQGYARYCYAFPGRVTDESSRGCNALIRENVAALITSAEDFVHLAGWETETTAPVAVQRSLFVELTDEEERVLSVLRKAEDGIQVNELVGECDIPFSRLSSLLFNMELKGVVRALPGACYRALD